MSLARVALFALCLPVSAVAAKAQITLVDPAAQQSVELGADPRQTQDDRPDLGLVGQIASEREGPMADPVLPPVQRTRGLTARGTSEPRFFVIPWQTGVFQ